MGKYFALTVIVLLQMFWQVWGVCLAWGAADSGFSGIPFWQGVREELDGRSPELTQLWLFVTIINACALVTAVYLLIRLVVRKLKEKSALEFTLLA